MENDASLPTVSVVEPLFVELTDRQLARGEVVDIGGTACRVCGKANVTRGEVLFVIYQFNSLL